ncbi:hypothetical protein GXM_03782 [Nostoc sphaeroides CCNUC1]|uniref:Uncharacterized protein n=1 Tax=Nostoc sphaeroides CCNUC1 TaxID=2653204 RepID=A0A5P8W129_9NOSO|nr:hypothetical protein GXM_03782 [Nostoc sphaeroides CCNUC1]
MFISSIQVKSLIFSQLSQKKSDVYDGLRLRSCMIFNERAMPTAGCAYALQKRRASQHCR